MLDEEFNTAQLAIDKATEKIHADEKAVAAKQRETDAVREQLTARGAELYIGAGNPAPLAGLDVSNARELGTAPRTRAPPPTRTASSSIR